MVWRRLQLAGITMTGQMGFVNLDAAEYYIEQAIALWDKLLAGDDRERCDIIIQETSVQLVEIQSKNAEGDAASPLSAACHITMFKQEGRATVPGQKPGASVSPKL